MGGCPYAKTTKATLFGTQMPHGQRSMVTLMLTMATFAPGAGSGPKQAQMTPNSFKPPCGPCPPGYIRWDNRLNPHSWTINVRMERFGPWETQCGAYHGPFGAVFEPFGAPLTPFWARVGRGPDLRSETGGLGPAV